MSGKRQDTPNSHTVSQPGNAEPSVREVGEPKRYAAHPSDLLVVTRPGMDLGGPSRDTIANADSSVSPIGSVGEPLEMDPTKRLAEL